MEAEFARPLWVFGMSSYEIIDSRDQNNLIACSYRFVCKFVDMKPNLVFPCLMYLLSIIALELLKL